MHLHTTASWPARDDRRAALVWLAIFWIFVGVGFGFDLHNYIHEQPPVPFIVHIHAIATTLWLLSVVWKVIGCEETGVTMPGSASPDAKNTPAAVRIGFIASAIPLDVPPPTMTWTPSCCIS